MSDPIIKVHKLGKQYRIGAKIDPHGGDNFRDVILNTIKAPIRNFRRLVKLTNFNDKKTDSTNDSIWALKDVSFEINRGEVIGIIGRNGSGKSTLLKILSRITEPTEGYAELRGRVSSLLEVGTGFHRELTGRENIYLNGTILGMKKWEIDAKLDEIIAFSEIEKFIDTPVKHYSSGMYVRLAFAVAANLNPDILLVDEVLAVGDAAFQMKCLGKMDEIAKGGRTVLFVSHNMGAIASLCSKVILLNLGKIGKIGQSQDVVNSYFKQAEVNEIIFNKPPIKRAIVRQLRDEIELVAEYEIERKQNVLCLGFVISDYLGNPICGSNPVLDMAPQPTIVKKTGVMRIILQYPKLLDGTYRISLWFGDGKEDYFHERDCLTLDVINMVGSKQLPASTVGHVFPKCKWIFE